LVEFLKDSFAQIQVPFQTTVRTEGVRYSFINYNFCFRRFFDLAGCSEFGVDFPPLKSRKKRDECIALWLKIIKFLHWPYINSDGDLFGQEYKTSISEVLHRRSCSGARQHHRQQQHSKRSREDSDTSDCGLRRECAESEGERCAKKVRELQLFSLYKSLGGTDTCIDSFRGYDNYNTYNLSGIPNLV
jgi:hypothetical protein